MENDTVIDSYINREYEVNQIERIKYGRLQSAYEGCSAVNVRIPEGYYSFGQGIKTKISPVKELMPGVCILVAQDTRTVRDHDVMEVCQCKEKQG
jgi:hypothetical protein